MKTFKEHLNESKSIVISDDDCKKLSFIRKKMASPESFTEIIHHLINKSLADKASNTARAYKKAVEAGENLPPIPYDIYDLGGADKLGWARNY